MCENGESERPRSEIKEDVDETSLLSSYQHSLVPKQFSSSCSTIDLMPSCKLEAPLSLSSRKIVEIFKFSMRRNRFYRLEETKNYLKVALVSRHSISSFLKCCFNKESRSLETVVEFRVKINEKSCQKRIKIQGLSGNPYIISGLIQDFSTRVQKYLKIESETETTEEESTKNAINSYYEFCKILSSEEYILGKAVNEFVQVFNDIYKEETSPEEPVYLLKQEVEKTVKTLFSDYIQCEHATEKIMMFCRPAVEKYLFSKVGVTLMKIYYEKYKDIDQAFQAKRENEISQALPEELRIDFWQSIEQLNRLGNYYCPGEKLNCLMGMLADAKSDVLERTRGQTHNIAQLEPLVISYILLKSNLKTPMAETKFLQDWETDYNPTIALVEHSILETIKNIK